LLISPRSQARANCQSRFAVSGEYTRLRESQHARVIFWKNLPSEFLACSDVSLSHLAMQEMQLMLS
jgi:hypothetical protein